LGNHGEFWGIRLDGFTKLSNSASGDLEPGWQRPSVSTIPGRAARQGYQSRNIFRRNVISGLESTKKIFCGSRFSST
jgi:hypothetical protein